MVFYPFVGYSLFWISLVVAIIMFANYKKFFPLFYMISISLYLFTTSFAIDVFDIAKTGILIILVASAVIFMIIGNYFSKIVHEPKK